MAEYWHVFSRHLIDRRLSADALRLRYPMDPAFPLLDLPIRPPMEGLREMMQESLKANGTSSLPCYPWKAPRIVKDKGDVKRRDPQPRMRSYHEGKRHKAASKEQPEEDDSHESLIDEEDAIDDDIDNAFVDHLAFYDNDAPLLAADEVLIEDALPCEDSLEETAPIRRRKKGCRFCGSTEHDRRRCTSKDITFLLEQMGLLPGGLDDTALGKRIVATKGEAAHLPAPVVPVAVTPRGDEATTSPLLFVVSHSFLYHCSP